MRLPVFIQVYVGAAPAWRWLWSIFWQTRNQGSKASPKSGDQPESKCTSASDSHRKKRFRKNVRSSRPLKSTARLWVRMNWASWEKWRYFYKRKNSLFPGEKADKFLFKVLWWNSSFLELRKGFIQIVSRRGLYHRLFSSEPILPNGSG